MQFPTIFAAALLASLVSAAPQALGTDGQSCGRDQSVACCNGGDTPQELGSGLTGLLGAANGILSPGSCQPISVPVIAGSLQDLCGSNTVQCCDSSDAGVLNINAANCLPIGVN